MLVTASQTVCSPCQSGDSCLEVGERVPLTGVLRDTPAHIATRPFHLPHDMVWLVHRGYLLVVSVRLRAELFAKPNRKPGRAISVSALDI